MRLFPTADSIEASTQPHRDRALDFLRILSLSVVVVGHLLLIILYFDGRCSQPTLCLKATGALDHSVALQWATWGLQIMPFFFFAGGAASMGSWKPGMTWGSWLLARCQRLYRPTLWFLAAMTLLVIVCHDLVPQQGLDLAVPQLFVLLWFLGVYTICLAFIPLLTSLTHLKQVAVIVALLYGLTGLVDYFRWGDSSTEFNVLLWAPNFLFVWLIPTVLGVAYYKKLLTPKIGIVLFLAALLGDFCLCSFGDYSISLLGTEDHSRISNFTPPSLLMAGHALGLSGLAVFLAPYLHKIACNRRVWQIITIGNQGAMTLYLWHWAMLFAMDGLLIATGLLPVSNSPPGLWPSKFQQAPLFFFLVFLSFVVLQPLENTPLPWWDKRVVTPGWRSFVAGASVLVAGGSILALARIGPQVVGLSGGIILVVSLTIARAVALPASSHRSPSSKTGQESALTP